MVCFLKTDGSKVYVIGSGSKSIFQYSLSTAWDISSASYDNKSFSVSSQDGTPVNLFFKPDGSKVYISGFGNDKIYQYSLSTAWDVSTASYDSKSFYVGSQNGGPNGFFFNPDGSKVYVLDNYSTYIYQYSLSTAWDISTASYDSKSFSPGAISPVDLFFKPDGSKVYILGYNNDTIYQYSLSTAWDVSTASYDNESFYVGSQASSPNDLFF